ncbi:phosphate/phosphite/phosphonate ABC transporter substrate-binding protein [Phenylobacterium sp.]|uniref:phosphate/phosphite/phosphonate ABC transporter substrate-binding protein n=1 Tax=Phenylobacterium sp. TaxID=1871053 RepID=UPI0025CEBF9D|nr:phosphate/phosphite/phosphonate ABC transporter substrate-binding protein [Phenylobacterium sp.]
MNRRIVLALAASVACVSAAALAVPAVAEPAKTELVFSVLSAESQTSAEKDWAPFIADLGKAVGMPVKAYYGSNYTALIEAMRFKQTDLGWFTNLSGLEAVRRAGGEVFARSVNPSGTDGYEGVIVVKKGSGITLARILKCDRSLNFGMGDAKSTSGTLAPMTYLFAPRKIDPATCFKTVRAANHEANLFSVANGLMDAATNNTASMDRLSLLHTEMAKRTLGNVEIVWRSPRIPEDPLIWRKDLDPALKRKIAAFMFSYGVGNTAAAVRQRAILNQIQTLPFKHADNTHLLIVREMEAAGQLVEARNKNDPAAIAKAEASLAQIRKEKAAAPKA